MTAGWMLRAALLAGLLAGSGCAMRSTVGAGLETPPAPESEAERSEVCATYAERLELTRAQMRQRNTFGRLDLLRTEHRRMERFVDAHCS